METRRSTSTSSQLFSKNALHVTTRLADFFCSKQMHDVGAGSRRRSRSNKGRLRLRIAAVVAGLLSTRGPASRPSCSPVNEHAAEASLPFPSPLTNHVERRRCEPR